MLEQGRGWSLPKDITRSSSEEVVKLLDDYFAWKVDTYKFKYYIDGFNVHPGELDDLNLERYQSIENTCRDYHNRANEILNRRGNELQVRQKRYVKVVEKEAGLCAEASNAKGYYFAPVDYMGGIQSSLPRSFEKNSGKLKTDTLEDFQNIIKLLRQVPRQIDQIQTLLEKGIENGITYHEASMSRVGKQFEILLNYSNVEDTDFYNPFKYQLLDDSKEAIEIQEEAKKVIENDVMPAFVKLKDFLDQKYSKYLRKLPGLSSINNEIYQTYLESHTTTKGITPEEVHQMGLDEIEKLQSEVMKVVREELKMPNVTFIEFFEMLKNDKNQEFTSENEVMEYFTKIISDSKSKIRPLFDEHVLNSDTFNVTVKPVPPGGGGLAYYSKPSVDGRRKGSFYINTQNLKAQKKFQATTLTIHEALPGHHLQLSFNKHSPIPSFLRHTNGDWPLFPGYTSHVEGWGLYSEFLGLEMGILQDPYQRIGFYSGSLLRAARLVVDTGLHAFGWSRDKAIEYMVDNTGWARPILESQVDRYITMPGQAVTYKIGEIGIQEARKNRQKELGDKFDLKAFHRHVLTCLGPISMLEECIKEEENLSFDEFV